jgi:hypothetical protein
MLKTALRAGPRFVRRILEIGSSPALPTGHVRRLIPPLRFVSWSYPWLLAPVRGRLPNALMKHLGLLPAHKITTETIASSMAITTKTRNARLSAVYHRALSPRQPTTPRRPPSGFNADAMTLASPGF